MSGETVFETPGPVNSEVRCIGETRKLPKSSSHPRLSDAYRDLLTRSEVELIVKRAASSDAELVNYHLRPYSEEKIGFLGSHLCLATVSRRAGRAELDRRSFFVKTLPLDVPSQAAYIEEKGCFKKEAAFVETLVPLLMKNYKGEPWTPECYLVKRNTLVFQDMKLKGFSNRSKIFDLRTMRSAVECIARFHASSLLAEEQLKGTSLEELCPEVLEETEFRRTGRCYEWYSNAIDLAVWLAEDFGLDASCIRRASELLFDMCRPSANKRNVVSHGDLWSSNMLFSDSGQCNLIDFQLMRYAPLAHDLMQLMYLCSSREFRRSHEQEMLELYYDVLTGTLAGSGYGDEVPAFAELARGVEEQRFPALVTAAIFHPTVLMDGKIAAGVMDNSDSYEAYYFQNRVPFVRDVMSKDPVYKATISETIRELVEMSLKVDDLPRPT